MQIHQRQLHHLKEQTKTAETIAKKQPHRQLIRDNQTSDTARSKYTQDKQYSTQRISKHYNYCHHDQIFAIFSTQLPPPPLQDRLQKQHQAEMQAKTPGFSGHPNYDSNLI